VRNLPRTALHRPTSDLGYGLPSLKAHAAQLTICHLHQIMSTPGYRAQMTRRHIHTISTTYTHWPIESIMTRNSSPILRCLVRAQRDAGTMFYNIPPLSLTNPIASTLRAHFTHQDNTLLASLRDRATHITDPHSYKQAYCEFTPRKTHTSLLPRLTPFGNTTSPHGHKSSSGPQQPPSSSNPANLYPQTQGPPPHSQSPSASSPQS
jgi:hypothetical protein